MKNIHQLQKRTYDETLTEIAIEYERAKEYVQFLKDVNKDMVLWTPAQKLAFDLFAMESARFDSWAYEREGGGHDWNGFDHSRLLKKAVTLINRFPEMELKELKEIVQILKG